MIFRLLLVIFTLQQVFAVSSRVGVFIAKKPVYYSSENGHNYFCKLKYDVYLCFWLRNFETIEFKPHTYSLNKNGTNQPDCSISAAGNVEKLTDEYRCAGWYGGDKPKLDKNDDFVLECTAADVPVKCSWSRNNQAIPIEGRYSFYNNRDCSLRVDSYQSTDKGTWTCKIRSKMSGRYILTQSYVLSDREETTAEPHSSQLSDDTISGPATPTSLRLRLTTLNQDINITAAPSSRPHRILSIHDIWKTYLVILLPVLTVVLASGLILYLMWKTRQEKIIKSSNRYYAVLMEEDGQVKTADSKNLTSLVKPLSMNT